MRILTQGQIEQQIMEVAEALEEQTHLYADLADAAAVAEADYKLSYARAVVSMAAQPLKLTAPEKSARAELSAAQELREWKLADARLKSTKEALVALRSRLDALRTLGANVRAQT